MAITEESRYQSFQRLEELLGPEKVATLMELLAPVGWADVATKRDLDHLATTLGERIDRSDLAFAARINELRAEVYREQRNQTLAIVGANATVTALVLAAFQLF